MRPATYLSLLLLSFNFCSGQIKEQKFKTVVRKIIVAFSDQDSAGSENLLKKDVGLYQLYRSGVYDNFRHYDHVGFSDSSAEKWFFQQPKGIKLLSLTYSKLPVYDCEKEAWSKKGLFVDTTKVDHMLSQICKDRNKNVPDTIPDNKIRFFYQLENKSRRVVLYDQKGREFVFYVSLIGGNWYLTIIDNVSSDCSA